MSIETIAILLLIAAVVAIVARRFRVPYSVGLVLAGMAIAILPFSPNLELTKQLVFSAFLPPLIFEAAFQLRWVELRKDLLVVLVLATVGVLISAAVTAAGMHFLSSWTWIASIAFGVLIAATDPVAVIATLKDAAVHGRVRLLVEAESLFNDGTAAVLFSIVIAITAGSAVRPVGAVGNFIIVVIGSILCGAIVGGLALLLAGATNDHLIETTFTAVAAYGSFLLAEHFHLSGVIATLTAGLIVRNVGHLAMAVEDRKAVEDFWEYAAFVANSLIFLLIGIRLAHQNYRFVLYPVLIAIVFVLVGRALAIYPLSLLFARSKRSLTLADQHVLFWGGLRGALALALALGLPPQMPQRQEIIAVAFAVVAFSILVQGLTIGPLLRKVAAS
jgi:Na+:H+ antiporter